MECNRRLSEAYDAFSQAQVVLRLRPEAIAIISLSNHYGPYGTR